MSITSTTSAVELRGTGAAVAIAGVERPLTLAALQAVVRKYRDANVQLRIVGSDRREAPVGDFITIDVSGLRGVAVIDDSAKTATFLAGTTVDEAAAELEAHGYSMVGAPADAHATVGGAVSVGARGYCPRDTNFSGSIVEVGLVTSDGEFMTVSARKNAHYWPAVRLGLGAVGIITHVTVRIRDYQALRAERITRSLDAMLAELDEARHKVDFYRAEWKPTSGTAKVHLGWLEDASPAAVPARAFALQAGPGERASKPGLRAAITRGLARLLPAVTPVVDRVSGVFDRTGAAGLRDGRDVAGRADVGNFIEYQFAQRNLADVIADSAELARVSRNFGGCRVRLSMLAGDSAFCSAAYGEPVVTLAIESSGARSEAAFREAESVFIRHGGLPNWGGWNTFNGAEAADVMPRFSDFKHIVHDLDPHGKIYSDVAKRLRLH